MTRRTFMTHADEALSAERTKEPAKNIKAAAFAAQKEFHARAYTDSGKTLWPAVVRSVLNAVHKNRPGAQYAQRRKSRA